MGVVGGQFIRDEHRVEQAPLHGSSHMLPIFRPRKVPTHFILGMPPHAGGMAIDAMLNETK
jgi:hypothetical protein